MVEPNFHSGKINSSRYQITYKFLSEIYLGIIQYEDDNPFYSDIFIEKLRMFVIV